MGVKKYDSKLEDHCKQIEKNQKKGFKTQDKFGMA